MNIPNLIEKLAELEHAQWMEWSKEISQRCSCNIDKKTLERWKLCWVPYSQLTDKQKEQDRVWARKVLETVKDCD